MKAWGRFTLLASSLSLPDHHGMHGTMGSYAATDAEHKQQYEQVLEMRLVEIYSVWLPGFSMMFKIKGIKEIQRTDEARDIHTAYFEGTNHK